MAALIPSQKIIYFSDEEKEKKIYEYIDQLILLFPDFDYFQTYKFYKNIEPELKSPKISSISSEIQTALIKLGYIDYHPQSQIQYILTEKGREAKKRGGHFKYEEYINSKEEIEYEKSKIDLELAKKTLKDYKRTKLFAILGFSFSVIAILIELFKTFFQIE